MSDQLVTCNFAAYTPEERARRDSDMRTIKFLLLSGLLAPGFAQAMDCSTTTAAQPLRPTMLAPVASELALVGSQLGSANGVLSQNTDESQSVDQVLLRIRIESCMATVILAPGVDNPAAYKPRTQYDNAPWRFNMTQNGKNMTTDEFAAWMTSRGVRVARGAGSAPAPAVPVQDGMLPTTPSVPSVQSPTPALQAPPLANPPQP
jgi:hypothetical protein